jgi:hypothetical protein
MTTVNVEVKVQIGAEEKIISTEEREATWNEQAKINALYTELGEEYATAQEREDQVVQYALKVLQVQKAAVQDCPGLQTYLDMQTHLGLGTIVRLYSLGTDESTEDILRRMYRENKLGQWL